MRCLTLTQPYATLISVGAKQIETRSWSTSYRGPLLIHAAKGLGPVGGKQGLRELWQSEPFLGVLANHIAHTDQLPLGAIVAVCELIECWPIVAGVVPGIPELRTPDGWVPVLDQNERAFGNYAAGRWAWLLTNIRALPEPIPARGALNLWEYTGELPL